MASNYFLLFKTAQSEFRAWENLPTEKQASIIPIVELTRGRKIANAGKGLTDGEIRTTPKIYAFESLFKKVIDLFSNVPVSILDVTREEALSCYELDQLTLSDNKYEHWCNFVNLDSLLESKKCVDVEEELVCFFDKDWDTETYLSIISNFYAIIITLLIGLLGIVGVFAFVVIRSNALSFAEEQIQQEVTRVVSNEKIKSLVGTEINEIAQAGANKAISEFMNRLDSIEYAIEELGGSVGGTLEYEDEETTKQAD